ncbi:hypothetical protein NOV72_01061 [Caballeronia novacaledonica]|uniref:Uncharacterized protein n=1 Tax=Caballeronia novacaledonica TaxID=1544861 RepID=A0A2U3I140_9BURK|nr:hypothetical protein [Caballeronia novacaledonica]SPB13796.1 hypothetical protein NOV72_01061 [Caballeronia novacaledonica]
MSCDTHAASALLAKSITQNLTIMANGINRYFLQDTKSFIQSNYLTTAGIFRPPQGASKVDLVREEGVEPSVVRIVPRDQIEADEAIRAHWVPQGGYCDVPIIGGEKNFVFTPDFSGCSLLVDQRDATTYRVYHVTGGSQYFTSEYATKRSADDRLAAAMTYEFYGTAGAPRAVMFMKFEENRWWIYYQSQTGAGYGLSGGNAVARVQGSQLTDSIRLAGRMPVSRPEREVPLYTGDRLCDGQLVIPDADRNVKRDGRRQDLLTEMWIY